MSTAIVTSKGRITVPAKVRDALRIKAGDRIEFIHMEPGRFEVLAVTQSVTVLKGLIRKPTAPVTIATMNNAISAHGAKAR